VELAAAADKMHDFEVIVIVQRGFRPLIPGNNRAVQLDGHPVGLKAELLDQRRQREIAGKAAGFAVDNQGHERIVGFLVSSF
jgi:hypothetical protein